MRKHSSGFVASFGNLEVDICVQAVQEFLYRDAEQPVQLAEHINIDRLAELSSETLVDVAGKFGTAPITYAFLQKLVTQGVVTQQGELRTALQKLAQSTMANTVIAERAREQLRVIGEKLAETGIEVCLLKGACRLFDDLWPNASYRPLGDLDILVPAQRADEAQQVLLNAGYSFLGDNNPFYNLHHHLQPLALQIGQTPFSLIVEVHRALGQPRIARLLPAGDVLSRAIALDKIQNGLTSPALDDQLRIASLHASHELVNSHRNVIRLRDYVELELLARKVGQGNATKGYSMLGSKPDSLLGVLSELQLLLGLTPCYPVSTIQNRRPRNWIARKWHQFIARQVFERELSLAPTERYALPGSLLKKSLKFRFALSLELRKIGIKVLPGATGSAVDQ